MSVNVDEGPCPCGCGEWVDPHQSVGNVWHLSDPCWAWMCSRAGCTAHLREQKNQTGDSVCPWCGHARRLVGHFSHSNNIGRVTMTGKTIPHPRIDTISIGTMPYVVSDEGQGR